MARVESVTYAGHAWRYRYPWAALQQAGATEGERPRVWVAAGSHASYPAPCGKGIGSRKQLNGDLPDGQRNGRIAWPANDDGQCARIHCVARLPLTREKAAAGGGAPAAAGGWHGARSGEALCSLRGAEVAGGAGPLRQSGGRSSGRPAALICGGCTSSA